MRTQTKTQRNIYTFQANKKVDVKIISRLGNSYFMPLRTTDVDLEIITRIYLELSLVIKVQPVKLNFCNEGLFFLSSVHQNRTC